MKKDVFVAIIVGFVIGAIAALAIVNLPSLLKKPNQQIADVSKKTAAVTPATPSVTTTPLTLEITQPKNEEIVTDKNIKLAGKTQPGNTVVIDSNDENAIIEAGGDGSFSTPLTLTEGGNTYVITSYNDKAEGESKTITLFYTTDKL